MRRRLPVLVLLAAGLLVTPAADAAKPRPRCDREAGHTVKRTSQARLFERRGAESVVLYGCLRRERRRVRLARAFDDGYTESADYLDVRLSGTWAAWQATTTDVSCKADCPPGYSGVTSSVVVRGLRRGAARRVAPGAAPIAATLLLTRGGIAAWQENGAAGITLHVLERSGPRVLDPGPVDPGSVRLDGSVLAWTVGGEGRTAAL
jgi:hypothetical protein